MVIIGGSLETMFRQYGQTKSTARKKLTHGESQKEDKIWRRSEMEKVRRDKMQVCKKIGKSQTLCFPNYWWLWRVEN